MHPQATISHQTAHRLRLHIPRLKRNSGYFARLRDELSKCAGVERVEANPQTASVLIHHRSTPEAIARFAEEMQLFILASEHLPFQPSSLATRVNTRVLVLNERLTVLTRGSLDLPSVTAVGFVALGLFQSIVRRNVLPSGANMFWWAASLLAAHYQNVQSSATGEPAAAGRESRRQTPRRRSRAARTSSTAKLTNR